ncbi:hypothetical protein PLESTM_001771300 [Pleodorina starrii]|nr:hypothetical protein PLESTM_001771300 [Pleodorina starrii]
MDKFAVTVLQGISLSPIPTCSCAKGLAAGLRIVTNAWPAFFTEPAPTARYTTPTVTGRTTSPSSRDHQPTLGRRTTAATAETPSTSPKLQTTPDLDLASEGTTGAREAYYMMLMGLPR